MTFPITDLTQGVEAAGILLAGLGAWSARRQTSRVRAEVTPPNRDHTAGELVEALAAAQAAQGVQLRTLTRVVLHHLRHGHGHQVDMEAFR